MGQGLEFNKSKEKGERIFMKKDYCITTRKIPNPGNWEEWWQGPGALIGNSEKEDGDGVK